MADYRPADNWRLTIGQKYKTCILTLITKDCIDHTNILSHNVIAQCITKQHYQHVCQVCIYNCKTKICVFGYKFLKHNFNIHCHHIAALFSFDSQI